MALLFGRNTRNKRPAADFRNHFENATMRPTLVFCLLLAIALPCHAQGDQAKPNTLTPKEIADGWILLFDGATTFGWRSEGNMNVREGALTMGGRIRTTAEPTFRFFNYEISCEYAVIDMGASKEDGAAEIQVICGKNGPSICRLSGSDDSSKPAWKRLKFVVNGDKAVWDERGEYSEMGTPIRLYWVANPRAELHLRNFKLRPLTTKPLFNGTDLTGWREFPGKKSKFTVTDSAINVKDGPGDLQTVGKYQDFVLQVECKSNGKHLNSGIFFRCKENEYQNGYEAQILNKFSPEATQKYLVEEYDAKTNKLLGKKEILSTAFDYGTGAIYRRVPARKQMSKDGEWFGMTIVAHGNHLATWVNGVQVTDWYDNRPKSDNARTGCKVEAGHVSIQGHDPTTDLSFRNFRIAELK